MLVKFWVISRRWLFSLISRSIEADIAPVLITDGIASLGNFLVNCFCPQFPMVFASKGNFAISYAFHVHYAFVDYKTQ